MTLFVLIRSGEVECLNYVQEIEIICRSDLIKVTFGMQLTIVLNCSCVTLEHVSVPCFTVNMRILAQTSSPCCPGNCCEEFPNGCL
jgi:hypothetical protein